ncbi:single-stranded DNA binding protein [Halococcoides cellulosivorans]|uniref:Replication factor A n=1 Tax=Halococcoides cellulosivorans TaxID=1679096 RepID=A0A2R4X2E5_9EURY|nr:single-stranded DNA binding protein [Halococcoides cellulosivorans]AWB27967.1 replication factor A [Halococcoides cellulosivorans]
MGAIEEVHADLDAEVSEEDFREAVEAKVEQMGGLADERTAAMLVAHELEDGEVEAVADLEAGMDEVELPLKVCSIGEIRTFERDDEEGEGQVINVRAADETGGVRLAFWDGRATAVADGEIEVGDVIMVRGRPKEGYDGLEISVSKAQVDEETEIDVDPDGEETIDALRMGQSDVTVQGQVLSVGEVRTFDRDDGSEGRVANLAIGDETGRIRVTLWGDRTAAVETVAPGETIAVIDGYVRERDGGLELQIGDRGAVETVDEEVTFDPDATPIDSVEIGTTVDLAGVVRSTDPIRTFDRDDGSEGQVKNVRLQDESGDIRVALWGDHADTDVGPGEKLYCGDVEIQDGWQDDLEASAGWQSTVAVLDGSVSAGAGGSTGETASASAESSRTRGGSDTGGTLAAYADDESGGSTATTDADTETADAAETTEYTGTVVQTGDPVILDDGQETVTVATDADLHLGEEITVRGPRTEDHIDAEDVF